MSNTTSTAFSLESSLDELNGLAEKYRTDRFNTIAMLQDVQETFGYIPEEAVAWLSEEMDVPESRFSGVSTFYAQFRMTPRGRNVVTVCCGTACHVKGAEKVLLRAQTELGLGADTGTTPDMEFTLEKVACLGTCSMAPAVLINEKMHATVKPDGLARELRHLKKAAKE